MKRPLLPLFLTLSLMISGGCSGSRPEGPDATSGASTENEEEKGSGSLSPEGKILVVFFSRKGENYNVGKVNPGNTAMMANHIIGLTQADSFEIIPVTPYPESYDETLSVATNEKNSGARPSFEGEVPDMEDYGTVLIGSPIWWAEPPMIMHTFCEACPELGSKVIIPFGSHEGSGISSLTSMLKEYYPKARFMESFAMRGTETRKSSAKDKIKEWLEDCKILH